MILRTKKVMHLRNWLVINIRSQGNHQYSREIIGQQEEQYIETKQSNHNSLSESKTNVCHTPSMTLTFGNF